MWEVYIFAPGLIPFGHHLNAISACQPCKCAVPMEGGKKQGLGTGQPVSGWANRTLGESWSVALVGEAAWAEHS